MERRQLLPCAKDTRRNAQDCSGDEDLRYKRIQFAENPEMKSRKSDG
jgi:hypothetical protein